MNSQPDRTHDAGARSWVAGADASDTPFPLQNLPFGRMRHAGTGAAVVVLAIGDLALDVAAASTACGFSGLAAEAAAACAGGDLNRLAALSPDHSSALRQALFDVLDARAGTASRPPMSLFTPRADAEMILPVDIGDYTDFFCSMHHAVNASRIFRRPEALRPNYHYLPVGYHGRASSVVVSGTPVRRPVGQLPPAADGQPPEFAPSRMLDYEVELGVVLRGGNALGQPVRIDAAPDAVFGLVLLNDWSARDIQRWENLPLGPFLSKSFATSISPWIVTLDALKPFLHAMPDRPADMPKPPAYLRPADGASRTWDIEIECAIATDAMRRKGLPAERVATSRLLDMHWTVAQMVTHHASNGCNLRPGDLFGSGTISGPGPDTLGCLLELTQDGREPVSVGGEEHGYLGDGSTVRMTGWCRAPSARTIGFGTCEGLVLPALG